MTKTAVMPPGPRAFDRPTLESFRRELDALHERTRPKVGSEDLEYITRVDRWSRIGMWTGRALVALSPDPITFALGVAMVTIGKQLQATEVGHAVLHGAYDQILTGEGAAHRFNSKTWVWLAPIDEASWRDAHNIKHHQYANIVGRDPDVASGVVRCNQEVPWESAHRHQLANGLLGWLFFASYMNAHVTGLVEHWSKERKDYTVLSPDDPDAGRKAYASALRKWKRYYLKELVLIPLLTGPFFIKTLIGNLLSEVLRDVYTAATIWCGHIGEDTAAYPKGTRAGERANWYRMQVEASNNFEVPLPVSMLCGALDRQIEHHLFPRLPTNRLREIAPEVRAICERHGVPYRTGSWGNTLFKALRQTWKLQADPSKTG